eukprot:m.111627 g.111627  ORF g.111627 m.111627 type:complete len:63 (+) comp14064_c0_seq4:2131-2319(+)
MRWFIADPVRPAPTTSTFLPDILKLLAVLQIKHCSNAEEDLLIRKLQTIGSLYQYAYICFTQ